MQVQVPYLLTDDPAEAHKEIQKEPEEWTLAKLPTDIIYHILHKLSLPSSDLPSPCKYHKLSLEHY
jgi:hypothetical protein